MLGFLLLQNRVFCFRSKTRCSPLWRCTALHYKFQCFITSSTLKIDLFPSVFLAFEEKVYVQTQSDLGKYFFKYIKWRRSLALPEYFISPERSLTSNKKWRKTVAVLLCMAGGRGTKACMASYAGMNYGHCAKFLVETKAFFLRWFFSHLLCNHSS